MAGEFMTGMDKGDTPPPLAEDEQMISCNNCGRFTRCKRYARVYYLCQKPPTNCYRRRKTLRPYLAEKRAAKEAAFRRITK